MLKFTSGFLCFLLLSSSVYSFNYDSKTEDTYKFLANTIKYSGEFNKWIDEFNPFISTFEHYIHLFDNWITNHKYIQEINSQNLGYSLGHNQFSGMSHDEFREYMGFERNRIEYQRKQSEKSIEIYVYSKNTYVDLPESVDWRVKGVVNPIKDQGQCGSCYSFSVASSIESAYALKYGSLVALSEQQIVDCSQTKYDGINYGCEGGMIEETFNWEGHFGGLCLEQDYPYVSGSTQVASACKTSCSKINGTKVVSFTAIEPNSDLAMMSALVQQPVSVAIEADQRAFQFYSSGVFTGTCGKNLDHAVNVVGYGTDKNGLDYYILRNSWGTSWGVGGYMFLARGSQYNSGSGQCGVLLEASYPNL